MIEDKAFKEEVIRILINNFGVATAKLYEPMFLVKNKIEIVASLEQLLTEFVGRDNTGKQLECLYKQNI